MSVIFDGVVKMVDENVFDDEDCAIADELFVLNAFECDVDCCCC